MTRALRIDTDTTVHEIEVDGLEQMQAQVRGDIQVLPMGNVQHFELVCNENGKDSDLPVNDVATALWLGGPPYSDVLMGPVLMFGPDDGSGEFTSIGATEKGIVELLLAIGGMDVVIDTSAVDPVPLRMRRVDVYYDGVNGDFDVTQDDPEDPVRVTVTDRETGTMMYDSHPEGDDEPQNEDAHLEAAYEDAQSGGE